MRIPTPSTIVLVMTGPIDRADIAGFCERIRGLLEANAAELILCDVGFVRSPDAVTLDCLARLQLTARRLGRRVRVLDARGELREVLDLAGLSDVVPCADLSLESRRHIEEREPARGVEEERDPADPVAG